MSLWSDFFLNCSSIAQSGSHWTGALVRKLRCNCMWMGLLSCGWGAGSYFAKGPMWPHLPRYRVWVFICLRWQAIATRCPHYSLSAEGRALWYHFLLHFLRESLCYVVCSGYLLFGLVSPEQTSTGHGILQGDLIRHFDPGHRVMALALLMLTGVNSIRLFWCHSHLGFWSNEDASTHHPFTEQPPFLWFRQLR